VKLCSQVLACFLLSATLAVPALAAPDSPANPDRDARRAQKLAKKAERAKTRAKKKAARARSKSAKEATTSKHQVSAEELGKRVAKLQDALAWHSDLEEARQAAVLSNKPILWIQALGDLSGLL
jgi:hypothetical protein